MKRIVLAFTLLLAGGTSFFALNAVVHRAGLRLCATQSELSTEAQRLAELEIEKKTLTTKVRALLLDLQRHGGTEIPELAGMLESDGLISLKPEALEKLRADLGLSWHSSAEWVLLSKTTLATVGMNALKGNNLTDAACGVLAITPDERQRLNNAFGGTREEFANWAKSSFQREGTNGQTLARFTIPPNFELAATLSNKLASTVLGTLGHERTELLQHYAEDWNQMDVGGFATMTNTLTVSRRTNVDGTSQLFYDFSVKGSPNQGSGGQSGQIMQGSRYFPPSFKSLFPGGWREMAEREGFDFPNESQPR